MDLSIITTLIHIKLYVPVLFLFYLHFRKFWNIVWVCESLWNAPISWSIEKYTHARRESESERALNGCFRSISAINIRWNSIQIFANLVKCTASRSTLLSLSLCSPWWENWVTNTIRNVLTHILILILFAFDSCVHLYICTFIIVIVIIILVQWEREEEETSNGSQNKYVLVWFAWILPANINIGTETNKNKRGRDTERETEVMWTQSCVCVWALRLNGVWSIGEVEVLGKCRWWWENRRTLLRKPLWYHVSNRIKWIQVAYRILFPSLKMNWNVLSIGSLLNNHSHHVIWNDRPHYYPYSIECECACA